jgi:hypothetical protein
VYLPANKGMERVVAGIGRGGRTELCDWRILIFDREGWLGTIATIKTPPGTRDEYLKHFRSERDV